MSGEQQDKQQPGQGGSGAYEDVAETTQGEASAAGGQAENPEAGELESRIQEAVSAALAEQRDTVLRAQAELQNMRRRCEADVEKAHKFALERFSGELLSVVDNLERALNAVPEDQREQMKSFTEGVELTLKSFLETLARFNIEQVDPLGQPFDPQLHNAVATVPNPEVEPNTVIDCMQKGYTLNGRVIRPAMVAVARSPG